MTDRDLTRAEVEAWISEGPSHGVHIHAFSRILRQFLRCMDERALAQTETADLLTVSREECTRLVERAETAETEVARLREALKEALSEAPEVQALIAEAVERATRVKPLVWQDFAGIEVSPDESVSDDNLAVALCSYFDKRLDCPDDDEEGGELDDYDCWKVWVSENAERVLRRIANKANQVVEARIRAATEPPSGGFAEQNGGNENE